MIFLFSKGHHSSRLVLAMMRIIILLKKMLKAMIIFSKVLSIMKSSVGKEMTTRIFLILLTITTRMSLEELFHQECLSPTGTKFSFLAIVFLAKILVIRQYIVELMQEVIK
jgi:hypothetical protein